MTTVVPNFFFFFLLGVEPSATNEGTHTHTNKQKAVKWGSKKEISNDCTLMLKLMVGEFVLIHKILKF